MTAGASESSCKRQQQQAVCSVGAALAFGSYSKMQLCTVAHDSRSSLPQQPVTAVDGCVFCCCQLDRSIWCSLQPCSVHDVRR
jgi:hypothetical protein